MQTRKYYTLVARDNDRAPWTPQFGDYDRQTVIDEIQHYVDSGTYKRMNLKVIVTADDQPAIDRAVRLVNYPLSARAH